MLDIECAIQLLITLGGNCILEPKNMQFFTKNVFLQVFKCRYINWKFTQGARGSTRFKRTKAELLAIASGVQQGCVLAPILFGMVVSLMIGDALSIVAFHLHLDYRIDGKSLDISRRGTKSIIKIY